jgi:hypothetical protein
MGKKIRSWIYIRMYPNIGTIKGSHSSELWNSRAFTVPNNGTNSSKQWNYV